MVFGSIVGNTFAENELSASDGLSSASLSTAFGLAILLWKTWNEHGFCREKGACGGKDSDHLICEKKKSLGTYKLLYRRRSSRTSASVLFIELNHVKLSQERSLTQSPK